MAKSEYKVFAPTGRTVFDQRFDSGAKGIANIFKAATRSNPDALEGKLVNELGITGAHVDYIVDFASVAGRDDSKGFLGRMAGQDQAEVTSTVELAISGSLKLVTPESINCHKLGCDTNNAIWPAYQSKRPLIAQGKFHNGLRDAQSTANKIGEGIANVVGFLAAMSGGSGSSQRRQWELVQKERPWRRRDIGAVLMLMLMFCLMLMPGSRRRFFRLHNDRKTKRKAKNEEEGDATRRPCAHL